MVRKDRPALRDHKDRQGRLVRLARQALKDRQEHKGRKAYQVQPDHRARKGRLDRPGLIQLFLVHPDQLGQLARKV